MHTHSFRVNVRTGSELGSGSGSGEVNALLNLINH